MPDISITVVHCRRLREVYRSAGWPYRDGVEIELLAAGLLERRFGATGHETLHVTDAGLALIAATLARNRARRDPHEGLVERIAREMTRAGRLAWRGLALRAQVDGAYRHRGSEGWEAIREAIAEPDEIPPAFGVLVAGEDGGLRVARPAPKRPMRMPFGLWMARARATPVDGWRQDDAQALLGDDSSARMPAGS